MFTSRAQDRLLLRVDNADLRLTARARTAGLIDDERWDSYLARERRYTSNLARIRTTSIRPPIWTEGAR